MSKELEAVKYLKENKRRHWLNNDNSQECLDIIETAINKLGQLEYIEELCKKVVEKPIYEKFIDTHEIHKEDYTECCALYSFKHNRIELYMYDFVNYLELDQYGKTWALTKEELL